MLLKLACFVTFLILSASTGHSNAQQSCPDNNNGGALVGFTALTPQQLQDQIHSSIQDTMAEVSQTLRSEQSEQTSHILTGINQTVRDGLTAMAELNNQLEQSVLSHIEAVVERQVKQALSEALESILANITIQPPAPPTEGPVTEARTDPITEMPTTERMTTEAPTTEAPTTERPTTETTTEETTMLTTEPLPTLPPIGLTPLHPATSCQQILESQPDAPTSTYWVWSTANDGIQTPTRVYCDMERSCGGLIGGWMRVVLLNMRDPATICPSNFRVETATNPSLRLCRTVNIQRGCVGTFFPVSGVSYSHVCGRVIGYHDRTPNAFYPYHVDTSLTINDSYVDGISLTHGPRRDHIWTFVAALDETLGHLSACQCSNRNAQQHARIPSFVGRDYFCDTGSRDQADFRFYGDDPLWDGRGCGTDSTCCTFNNPPWFYKRLGSPSREDIEMRVCRDSSVVNEDILFEIVELYVR